MPDSRPQLLVAGSVALDTRDGPFGKVDELLGGSAVYFALAASLIVPVKVVAPVGLDGVKQVAQAFSGRHIDTDLLQILEAPTYRWSAHQEHGRNVDLGSSDDIYNSWEPVLPADFDGWAFVGSMRPDRQAYLMKHLGGASFLAADAMLSYVKARPSEARDALRRAGWFFCNQEELEALGGKDPEEFRRQWWLKGLVVKAGADGLAAYTEYGVIKIPAHTHHSTVDTTGAGDALAGGMLARWMSTGGEVGGLQDALVWGVACASITVSAIGVKGIAKATRNELHERVAEVEKSIRAAS
ncbi:MAG TPA: PfkB family carbohydrate kinase [Candidatus Dormibacteraeota bacterium]|nr:PfkB family carbohydrate kinase [Candidatus Dormibacteraeota bacterium]